jgi:tetratricopeptide (TPR) repeat protein
MFFLILGYINFLTTKKKKIIPKIYKEPRMPSVFLTAILLILALVLIYQTNIEPAKANYATTRAILTGRAGDVQKAVNKYQQAINYDNPQGGYETRHKLATFAIQFSESQRQKNDDFDPSLLYYSIDKVGENIEKYPLDTIPYLYVGRMYILLIRKQPELAAQQAEESIKRALDLNRNNPRIWYELGQTYLSMAEYQESYEAFKKALDLNPKVATSWWFVGATAYQVEKYEEAVYSVEKAMELGYGSYKNSINDLMRLVNIYEKVNNVPKVIEYYELAVAEQPTNAQLYASLAAAYAKIGDYDKARIAALKAAEINSDFKEEAEQFINSLPGS